MKWDTLGKRMNFEPLKTKAKYLKLRMKNEKKGKDRQFYELPSNLLKCLVVKLVEAEGIEPSSARDPQKGATYLVFVLIYLLSFQRQNISRHSHSNS